MKWLSADINDKGKQHGDLGHNTDIKESHKRWDKK